MIENNTVYFVGSGPGDPELITIKAKKLLENADLVIYSGSLLNPELLKYAKKRCKIV
jgi:precorrin-4/cobalt-precorrin-4 C11-methyltransferase